MPNNDKNAGFVSEKEFSSLMEKLDLSGGFPDRLAIAVSGGGDSMALCLLAKNWCDTKNIKLTALTF